MGVSVCNYIVSDACQVLNKMMDPLEMHLRIPSPEAAMGALGSKHTSSAMVENVLQH